MPPIIENTPAPSPPVLRTISEQELEKHSDESSRWTSYKGQVHDITAFVESGVHPGGWLAHLCSGRDATELIESYHAVGSLNKVDAYFSSHCPVVGAAVEKPTAPKKDILRSSEFWTVLEGRVMDFLSSTGRGRHNEFFGIGEATLTFLLFCVAQYIKITTGSLLASVAVGFLTSRFGYLMHMGCHGAMSKYPTVNHWVAGLMDLAGGSSVNWSYDHNVSHHLDPNNWDKDNDTMVGTPLVRLHPKTEWKPWHKFQHITTFILMAGGMLSWYFLDMVNFIQNKVGYSVFKPTRRETVTLFAWKLFFFCINILLPLHLGIGLGRILLCVAIQFAIPAELLENTFIVNHIQEGLIPPPDAHWAVKQVLGSVNWASRSHFWNWWTSGLNHQVEHHLFPSLSHYYYPDISPIVQQTCEEFGFKYGNHDSFYSAWSSMRNYLEKMSKPDYDPKKSN